MNIHRLTTIYRKEKIYHERANKIYMEKSPAVSIIIPIYNVGDYLYRCLSSVACQTFKNFEAIMINDGSTDKSPVIAADFAKNFSNFSLVHNDKKGVASARNLGIKLAKGEYVAFVDSDDYIDPNYLYRLYNAAKKNNADVSHCNYALYNIDSGFLHPILFRKPHKGILTNMKMAKRTVSDYSMRSYLWNKLWKRTLFTENNIEFPEMYFEDIATTARLLYYANKGVVIDKYLYYYTMRDGSIVKSFTVKKLNDYLLSLAVLRRFFIDQGVYKKMRFNHHRLAFIMAFTNTYALFQIHRKCKNFEGFLKNIGRSTKSIFHIMSKEFAENEEPNVKYKMVAPENRRLIE